MPHCNSVDPLKVQLDFYFGIGANCRAWRNDMNPNGTHLSADDPIITEEKNIFAWGGYCPNSEIVGFRDGDAWNVSRAVGEGGLLRVLLSAG